MSSALHKEIRPGLYRQLAEHAPMSKPISNISPWFQLEFLPLFLLVVDCELEVCTEIDPFFIWAVFFIMVFTIAIESQLEYACQRQGCLFCILEPSPMLFLGSL